MSKEIKPYTFYFLLLLILLSCGSPEPKKSEDKFLVIHVRTDFPNTSAEAMENLISFPLERSFNDLTGLIEQKSISQNGISVIKLIFNNSINSYEILSQVKKRIDEVSRHNLPSSLPQPPYFYVFDESFYSVLYIHYTNKKMYGLDFLGLVNEVRDELSKHPSIKEVKMYGAPEVFILLDLDSALLRKYDLTIEEVSLELQKDNFKVDFGRSQMVELTGSLNVLAAGNRIKIPDLDFYDSTILGGILIKSDPNVFLKDLIAEITTQSEDENLQNMTLEIFKNNEYSEAEVQAVALAITKRKKNKNWYICEIKKPTIDFKKDKLTTEFPELSNLKKPEITFILNRESCAKFGVSFSMVSNSISNLVLLYPEYALTDLLKFTLTTRRTDGIIQDIPLSELVGEIERND